MFSCSQAHCLLAHVFLVTSIIINTFKYLSFLLWQNQAKKLKVLKNFLKNIYSEYKHKLNLNNTPKLEFMYYGSTTGNIGRNNKKMFHMTVWGFSKLVKKLFKDIHFLLLKSLFTCASNRTSNSLYYQAYS